MSRPADTTPAGPSARAPSACTGRHASVAALTLTFVFLTGVVRADSALGRAAGPVGTAATPTPTKANEGGGGAAAKPPDWSMFAGKDDAAGHTPAQAAGPASPVPAQGAAPSAKPPSPTAPIPTGEFAKTAIHRGDKDTGNAAADPASASPSNMSDVPRVVLALAIVVVLILFLRWGGRRLFALPGGGRASHAVQVLSRSALTPRQQVVLLKVGRRVLVVADNGSQMSSLSQITDPDEVASLVGQLRAEKGGSAGSAGGAFGGLFGRSRKSFAGVGDDEPEPEPSRPKAAAAPGRAAAPGGRASAAGPVREADAPKAIIDPEDIGFDEAQAEAAVASARQELKGLKEKLRMVSERFGMPEEGPKARPRRSDGRTDRGQATIDSLFKEEASLFKEEGAR